MKQKYVFCSFIAVLFFFNNILTNAQSSPSRTRSIAILDLTVKNGESSTANLFSVEHICKTMGIPYVITNNVSSAINYSLILATSDFNCSTFSTTENNQILNYVNTGGVLIAPYVNCSTYNSLFGISSSVTSTKHYKMNWIDPANDVALRWIDDSLEKTISLGREDYANVIESRSYTVTSAIPLANYDDHTVGVIKNIYGQGTSYSIGIPFRSIIFNNQLNHDYEAQRTWGSWFEPTSDVIMLFIKGVFSKHVPFATWKNTAPYDNKSVFMMTHDCDWGQAMDTMRLFADWENARNIKASYYVTTHYISDSNDPDYYSNHIKDIIYVGNQGMTIGSHSVGHFEDFNKLSVFPMGSPGNTRQSYYPTYRNAVTTGGTCFGELEVSKKLLEQDCGAPTLKTYRSGYLDFNVNQITVLDSLGYLYDATHSANDVLTHFPFQQHREQSYNGRLSNVYEMPLTMDADPITLQNWQGILDTALRLLDKIKNNGGIFTQLIHPGRNYKLYYYEKTLFDRIPQDVYIMEMQDFGSFWRQRENFNYTTSVTNSNTLTITIPDSELPINPLFSIVIGNGKNVQNIIVQNEEGIPIQYFKSDFQDNDAIIYFGKPQNIDFTISQQPKSQSVCVGDKVRFSVELLGSFSYNYQWMKGSTIISGATNSELVLDSVKDASQGKYYCVISSKYNQHISDTAELKIFKFANPSIFVVNKEKIISGTDPNLYFCSSETLNLASVVADSVTYQWKRNGVNIANATGRTLTVTQPGIYTLDITNSIGCTRISNGLNLNVYYPPKAILSAAGSTSFCEGGSTLLTTQNINFENFETGDLSSYAWQTGGVLPWTVSNSAAFEGLYSAKSVAITHLQTSEISLKMDLAQNDSISFYRKISSELNYDFLQFYINNVLVAQWSGELGWQKFSYPVLKGENIFKWVYSKDRSVSTGSDCAWLDKIVLPKTEISPNVSYQWKLDNNIIQNAIKSTYSANKSGSYNVSETSSCGSAQSLSVIVKVLAKPNPIVTADGSTTICSGKSVLLNGTINDVENFETANFTKFAWSMSGDLPWTITNADVFEKLYSSRSGTITDNQVSAMSLILNLPVADSISFARKVSSELNYDYLRFYINGVKIGEWSGEVAWSRVAYLVPAGTVTLRWEYSKDRSLSKGSDCAIIDKIVLPNQLNNGIPTYQWFKDNVAISGANFYTYNASQKGAYKVDVTNNCGYKFSDSLNVTDFSPVATITANGSSTLCLGDSVTLKAANYSDMLYQWKLNGAAILNATSVNYVAKQKGQYSYDIKNSIGCSTSSSILNIDVVKSPKASITAKTSNVVCGGDSTQLVADIVDIEDFETGNLNANSWIGGGNASWTITNSGAYDGTYCAKSGLITHLQTSELSLTLNILNDDSISFYRKVSSETSYDFLQFYINNVLIAQWSGEQAWLKVAYPVLKGMNVFKWVYSKDRSVSVNSDCAWLDNIKLPKTDVGTSMNYAWIKDNAVIPGATSSTYFAKSKGNYNVTVSNHCGAFTTSILTISETSKAPSLISADGPLTICEGKSVVLNGTMNDFENFETGGFTKYSWLQSGNLNWTITNADVYENLYATKSGAITNSQATAISLTLTFPKSDTISFYRKVSSELAYDFLRFYINGTKIAEWSGEVAWSRVAYIVPAGTVTFKWEYSKDATVSKGSDCAWLDKIVFPSTSATAQYIYQWAKDGIDISGATNNSYAAKLTGDYTVKTGNSCGYVRSNILHVNVNPAPVTVISAIGATTFCSGNSVTLSANNSSYQFQWKRNGAIISGAISKTYAASLSGDYTLLSTDNNGCSGTSNLLSITATPAPEVKIIASGNTTFCSGDSVVLTSNPISTDDFNNGNFNKFSWLSGGDLPWVASTTLPYEGKYCIKSGSITHMQSSELSLNYFVYANDTISFYVKVSSEKNYDFIRFYINGVKKGEWSGTQDWTLVKCPVSAGTNNFKWTYSKDISVSTGSDCGWIDKVTFPSSNAASAYSYQWQKNGTNISNAKTPVFTVKETGIYKLVITSSCGSGVSNEINDTAKTCSLASKNPTMKSTGISDNQVTEDNFNYMIYPDIINKSLKVDCISSKQESIKLSILNALGQIVDLESNIRFDKTYSKIIDLNKLSAGVYFLNIITENKKYVIKFFL